MSSYEVQAWLCGMWRELGLGPFDPTAPYILVHEDGTEELIKPVVDPKDSEKSP